MTLILTSVRPHDVVMTSDGRATYWDAGGRVDDAFVKIFPVPEHPVVIAHHGENEIGAAGGATATLGGFVGAFVRRLNAGNHTILQIADQLRGYAHADVRQRLRAIRGRATGCGFLVAGFSAAEPAAGPSVVEIFWKWDEAARLLMTYETERHPTSIMTSGSGQAQVEPVDWHHDDGTTVEQVRAYHNKLMDEAVRADVKPNLVGGRVHEVVITPEGWRWTLPPAELPAK